MVNIYYPENGFSGCLFTPAPGIGMAQGNAVIVLTGTDGGIDRAKIIARKFAESGFISLAVGYYKINGLHRAIHKIPLEYIERAILWLKEFRRASISSISIYGFSKGAEYALLASAIFPDIQHTIAVVPNYYAAEGKGKGIMNNAGAPWSYRGKALPFAGLRKTTLAFLRSSLKEKQVSIAARYMLAEKRGIPEDAIIPVEKSRSRILLLSASNDTIWPSKHASEEIIKRLDAVRYPYEYKHVNYSEASHFLSPLGDEYLRKYRFAMRYEREHPVQCEEARTSAWNETLGWLGKE